MKKNEVIEYIKKSFDLKSQGFYKPAIEMLYKALVIEPDNIEILAQLAQLYKLLENFKRANYYIEKVLEIDENHVESLSLSTEIYLLQNELNRAKELSEKTYKLAPTDENLAKIINILNRLNDIDSIKTIGLSKKSFNDKVLYELALAYYDKDFKKALGLLEKAYSQNKKDGKIRFLLARAYYENQNYEKAEEIFKNLSKESSNAQALNYIGLIQLHKQNFENAIANFTKAQKFDEKNAEYPYNLASAYFLNGWLDEAIKYFNIAICHDPKNINYHYSLAYTYYQKNLYDKALKELAFIKKSEPGHELSIILNSMILAKKGDLLTAKNQLENITKNKESDDFAYYALSQVYKELSMFEQAQKAINQAIELNPKSLNYLSESLEIKFKQKKYGEALSLANDILNISKNYLPAHIFTANIYLEQKDFESLYDKAQEIIELDSNSPEGYYYNAVSLFEQGDKTFAIESLKKAISLDLNNALLYAKMSEFYQETGDFKTAFDWAKEAGEIDDRNYQYKWLCAKIASVLKKNDEATKYYSQSYRLCASDKELCEDYAKYLKSIGKNKQAEKILKHKEMASV